MNPTYHSAVNYLSDFVEAMEPVYNGQQPMPNMETQLMYALKILKEQPQYGPGIQ